MAEVTSLYPICLLTSENNVSIIINNVSIIINNESIIINNVWIIIRPPDKSAKLKKKYFSYLSTEIYGVCIQKNRLTL